MLFAKEGAKVVVNYNTSKQEAYNLVEEIKKNGSDAIAIKCDVSKENEVENMLNEAVTAFGQINILVNNAGIVFDTPLLERTTEQFRDTLDTNLVGNFICSKYASKQMLKNGGGKIVNISSTNAINCYSPDAADYDASKAGIITLTKDFAKELAPTIQVNAIAPGWVNTDMNKDLPVEFIEKEKQEIYLKRFAEPEEIAKAVLFLASENANYITGSVLVVDGGHN
ncbi:MAG: 3-oxoacyl-(acyl-carrier protein) reductase [uncultured bacterium]|nr:MAG: 3-oxoacyl-(acyl-carrier protein) reductase [uncultured bacterium]